MTCIKFGDDRLRDLGLVGFKVHLSHWLN